MSEIDEIPIENIIPSRFRLLDAYPYRLDKLDTLIQSIEAIGLLPGIIGRRVGNKVEIAFGHYRIEASRRVGLKVVPIIIKDLTDDEMLEYLVRENMEDYNADFLTMMESWEAMIKFSESDGVGNLQPLDIAMKLGWARPRSDGDGVQMSRTAEACNSGYSLITAGHIKRSDLLSLPIRDAREILTRANANMKRLDKIAKEDGVSVAETNKSKRRIAKAIKKTAKEASDGLVAKKDLRARLDANAYEEAHKEGAEDPLFEPTAKRLCDRIAAMIGTDVNVERLADVEKILNSEGFYFEADHKVHERLFYELQRLSKRASDWALKLDPFQSPTLKTITGVKNGK